MSKNKKIKKNIKKAKKTDEKKTKKKQKAQKNEKNEKISEKKITVYYANVRSVVNKLDSLYDFLENNHSTVLCLSETWLTESILDPMLVKNHNFSVYRSDRITDTVGGGVAIFVPNCFSTSLVSELTFSGPDFECVSVFINNKLVSCVYRKPTHNVSDLFFVHIKKCVSFRASSVLVGDFNFPGLSSAAKYHTKSEKSFIQFCQTNGLSQCVNEATRGKNILDLVLTNDVESISNCVVGVPFGDYSYKCDHSSVVFCLSISCREKGAEAPQPVQYDWNRANWNLIADYYFSLDWATQFSTCVNIHDFWRVFMFHFKTVVNNFVPLSSQSVKYRSKFSKKSQRINAIQRRLALKYSASRTVLAKFAVRLCARAARSSRRADLRRAD